MLAGAVHPDALRLPELTDDLVARGGVAGPCRWAPQVGLGQARTVQDVAHDGDVPVGAGVAGRRQGEVLALEHGSRRRTAERLEGLHARTREDRRLDVPEGQRHDAVGIEHDRGARVPRLDEPAPLDDGEFDGRGDGEGLGHPLSLSPARRALEDRRRGSLRRRSRAGVRLGG